VTPQDALDIFNAFLNSQPVECPTSSQAQELALFTVIQKDINAAERPEEFVKVPILVENPEGISAFGLGLSFSTKHFEFLSVSRTEVSKDWIALDGVEASSGTITIGGFHSEAINMSSPVAICEVNLKVKQENNGKGELRIENLIDDFASAAVSLGSFGTEVPQSIPITYELSQNYPNPFNLNTAIIYELPKAGHVTLYIYNVLGEKIRTLVDKHLPADRYRAQWDGRNAKGKEMASGIYFYKLEVASFSSVKKLVLTK